MAPSWGGVGEGGRYHREHKPQEGKKNKSLGMRLRYTPETEPSIGWRRWQPMEELLPRRLRQLFDVVPTSARGWLVS